MSVSSKRAEMLNVLSGVHLAAVRGLLDEIEKEAIESLVSASEPRAMQERVRAVREVREQFKPPKGAGGQA